LNAKLFGLSSTDIVVPYLHSTEAPYSVVHGGFESLEYTISKGVFPLFVVGIIYLTAVTVGRLFCGWACPFGMLQDFLSYLPIKKMKLSKSNEESFKDVKLAFLFFSIITTFLVGLRRTNLPLSSPVGFFSDSPFSVLAPSTTLFTYIPYLISWKTDSIFNIGFVAFLKISFFLFILGGSIFIPRFFCKFFCPMGTLLEPLSKYKFLRIRRSGRFEKEKVNTLLNEVCPMGVQLQTENAEFIDHPYCIHCGKCIVENPKMLSQQIL